MRVLHRVLLIAAAGIVSFILVLLGSSFLDQWVRCDPYGAPQNCGVIIPATVVAFVILWAALAALLIRVSNQNVQ